MEIKLEELMKGDDKTIKVDVPIVILKALDEYVARNNIKSRKALTKLILTKFILNGGF